MDGTELLCSPGTGNQARLLAVQLQTAMNLRLWNTFLYYASTMKRQELSFEDSGPAQANLHVQGCFVPCTDIVFSTLKIHDMVARRINKDIPPPHLVRYEVFVLYCGCILLFGL